MYVNISSRIKISSTQIKKANPNISFPRNPSDDTLAALGYARIQPTPRPDGDVITQGSPEQREDGKWYQTWDVREFTAGEKAERFEQAKRNKQREINDAYESELNVILANYPDVETKTWDKQEQEARAYVADNTAATPLLTEIANARGMTLADLVPRVIKKADTWVQLSGAATGKRQALEAAIAAANTVDELKSIAWNTQQ